MNTLRSLPTIGIYSPAEVVRMDKTFDCVEMKRSGQQAVRDRLASMSKAEQLDYWQKRYREMAERQKQLRSGTTLPSEQ